MDLIRNLPPNILLTFSFRLEESNKKNYNQLIQELIRLDYAEIRIGSMNSEDIKEFATRRYNMKISDLIADYLNMTIGEPLSLVSTFNIITRENLEPNIESFEKILPEALNPVKTIYYSLDDKSQSWANSLCQLYPPMPLSVIGCMLKETKLSKLKDELDQNIAFRRMKKNVMILVIHHCVNTVGKNYHKLKG